nr:unnamed protein product [Callosobruchus analis]
MLQKFSDATQRWNCESCNKTYKHRAHWLRHTKYECGRQPQFTCDICNFWTYRRDTLKLHQITSDLLREI